MLRYNRKNKNLKIPVGIGTNNNVDSSLLFNVSDGDATAGDLVAGKTAYSAEGFIVGTLDLEGEKTSSYNEGYANGNEVGYNNGYNTGNEVGYNNGYAQGEQDGYVSGEADGYADGYAEGKEDGIEEILTEQSDANITPGDVLEGCIGYGANNERIVGTNVGGFDFGEIGYTEEDSNELNSQLKEPIEYTKRLMPIEPSISLYRKFYNNTNLVYAPAIDTSITTDMSYMFYGCSALKYVPLFDTGNVTSMDNMFRFCSSLATVSLFDTGNVTKMSYMFYGCSTLTTVPLFDTGNVTNMYYMFCNCTSLTTVPLFDTGNVTSMEGMFYSCNNLTTIPLFDTSKVTNMASFLNGCKSLKSIPQFNTSNVTTFYQIFRDTTIENIPLLDAGNVTNCGLMFRSVSTLKNLGGFKDLGKSFTGTNATNHTLELSPSKELTRESLLNVFNNLYDMNLISVTDAKITIPSSNTLTTEEIAIATNKGWTVQ